MRKISTAELGRMKITSIDSLNDKCSIHTPASSSQNSYGELTRTFNTTSNVACGFDEASSYETARNDATTYDADAVLRLPLTQAITETCEVTVNSDRYQVKGVTIGKTVKVIRLKRVELND